MHTYITTFLACPLLAVANFTRLEFSQGVKNANLEGVGCEIPGRERLAVPVEIPVVVLRPRLPQELLQRLSVNVLQDDENRV